MVKEQAVVLLSSGLDSTINIYQASKEFNVKLALTFDYGQRARVKEIEMAKKTSEYLAIPHKVVSLPWFSEFTETSLVNSEKHIPTEEVRIDDLEASQQSAKSVWVPNRNGIFLNIAAAYAEGIGAKYVIPGFNLEEATTFSDNSQDFIDQLNRSFCYSTSNHVEVKCFTTALNKTEIFRWGQRLNVKFDYIWPCYFSGEQLCGQCESCQRYLRAQREA